MTMTEAKRRANKKWNDANMTIRYDRISVLVPKGRKKDIAVYAKEHGKSINGIINSLLQESLAFTDDEWNILEV